MTAFMKTKSAVYGALTVRWTERYSEQLARGWAILPEIFKNVIKILTIFGLGISVNGSWINLAVHLGIQFGFFNKTFTDDNQESWSLEALGLKDFLHYFISSNIVSYGLYFGIGGFLHWYYYVRRRDTAEEWKCQPQKWLSPELELNELILGSCTLFMNATFSAFLSCYIANGGYSTVYYGLSDLGWSWFFLQWPVIFIYQDYITYWLHRLYHTPFLYKHFHKFHHAYKQPTAFSVTAIHPVECLSIQCALVVPLFLFPVHWFSFYAIAIYTYYHGIIDHSGINFKAFWWQPWQPDAIFHDNHHQYFHVNFGFNIYYWDKLHGTYRKKDRIYREDIFYGHGKPLEEATAEELNADIAERVSENPLAYRGNKRAYDLEDERENKALMIVDNINKDE